MKSNKDKFDKIGIFVLILITSIGMCLSYPSIKNRVNKYINNTYESSSLINELITSNYSLYYKLKSSKVEGSEKLKPSELFFNLGDLKGLKKDLMYRSGVLDNDIARWTTNLNNSLKNLDYYAIDNETMAQDSRSDYKIESLVKQNEIKVNIDKLKDIYDFYVVMKYDKKGQVTITNIHGASKREILRIFSLKEDSYSRLVDKEEYKNDAKTNPIKNATFVYAIPKNLKHIDDISIRANNAEIHSYNIESNTFISMALIFIVISALVIPYKKSKDMIGFRQISKLPFEIWIFVVLITLNFIFDSSNYIIRDSINGSFSIFGLRLGNHMISEYLIYIVNILYWFICFGLVFIETVTLKYIWDKGVKIYIRESSLIYKLIRIIINNLRITFKDIDLRNKNTKQIIILLGINLIFIIGIHLIFRIIFGMLSTIVYVAIIYSAILFILINIKLTDICGKYNKMLEITNRISEGNFSTIATEDLGVFQPLKEKIENIQEIFKNAVEKEVKSQNMKTELISNVSHDLKTPLTSIITYVDLLKDENLSDEKRMAYLDTLDRKSQRLQELIEDLFEISKATSGNISLNIVDVDIVSLMKQTLLELNDKIVSSSLIVRKNFPSGKVVLPLDSQRTFRAFENLIINITKYAMKGSRVYIDIIDEEDEVDVILKNMSASEIDCNIDEILERFVRGDKSRNTEGSGLGLAIAKSFIEIQGGCFKIDVDGDLFKVTMIFNKNTSI